MRSSRRLRSSDGTRRTTMRSGGLPPGSTIATCRYSPGRVRKCRAGWAMPCSKWDPCVMDEFARRAAADRRAYFEESAARRDLTAIIIEKDFWVCWTLRRLTRASALAEHLTFKGGTSLSKAYGVIARFSEDIDLTISRAAPLLCDIGSPMEQGVSGKGRGDRKSGVGGKGG